MKLHLDLELPELNHLMKQTYHFNVNYSPTTMCDCQSLFNFSVMGQGDMLNIIYSLCIPLCWKLYYTLQDFSFLKLCLFSQRSPFKFSEVLYAMHDLQ